jgi:hypothetical protein
MIIKIENKHETFTTEFNNMDVSLDQIFDSLKGMLIASGWHINTIESHIIEWAEQLKEE